MAMKDPALPIKALDPKNLQQFLYDPDPEMEGRSSSSVLPPISPHRGGPQKSASTPCLAAAVATPGSKSLDTAGSRGRRKPEWANPWVLEKGLVTDLQLNNWVEANSKAARGRPRQRSMVDFDRNTGRQSRLTSRLAATS